MKRKTLKKYVSLLAILVTLSAGMQFMPVEAGSSDIVVDSATYTDELDNSVWNNPDGDIVIDKDVIVFENSSSDVTRLITRKVVEATTEIKELVKVETSMQFTNLPEGETFALALGVKRIESMQGEPGNVELGFSNNGGLSASLIYYNEDGDAVTLGQLTKCGSLKGKVSVEAVINTDKMMTVTVNGKKLWTVELPVSGEGRIGFLQTGSCGVKLSGLRIVSHLYDAPENCDIYEDFESGDFNANLLSAKMRGASYVCWPSGTAVKKEGDNTVFRYTNAGECYIATKYMYSNFEISFDVPYLQRENVLDEQGNLVTAMSNRFGISYGGEASDFDYAGYTDAVTDVIWFMTYSTITSEKTGYTVDAAAAGYPFFAKTCDKGFSVKMAMQDSVVTVYMKWLDETEYTEVYKYQVSTSTPTGYLHIWTNGPTNMSIDNLKIVNKDINPKLVRVDHKTSIVEDPGDYDYQPMKKVYKSESNNEGFNWYLVLPAVAGVCVLALVIVAVVSAAKNKKRRAGDKHEI